MTDLDPRFKTTTIGHADHRFCSPLSAEKAARLVELLDLPPGGRVLDIGCGKAALLLDILARYPDATGVGVDLNTAFLDEGEANAQDRGLADRVTLIDEDATLHLANDDGFAAALCLGASHALGDYAGLLATAFAILDPGGLLLVGEGYWRQQPNRSYLAVLGADEEDMSDHAGNAERAIRAGFQVLYTTTANADEWDEYEGLYCRAKLRWAAANPRDPDAATIAADAQRWHDAYLRWGRQTLGFGYYLLRRP
jgi:SAM-dependent methyltransferase